MNEKLAALQRELGVVYFEILAKLVPGDTTLNQLRVLGYISLRSGLHQSPACHKEICATLKMPRTTVDRAISIFLKMGIISEHVDLDDGRKRLSLVNKDYPGLESYTRRIKEMASRIGHTE
jgi:DNA-binding MarR family transcriptional regulator